MIKGLASWIKELGKSLVKDFFSPDDHDQPDDRPHLNNPYVPPQVLVDGQGVILRMNGHDTHFTHEELGRINASIAWHETTGEWIHPDKRMLLCLLKTIHL